MIEVAYTNIQSKTKIIGSTIWFFYPYLRSFPGVSTLILLYITAVDVIAIFINSDGRIKRVQIGGNKPKQ